MITLLAVTLFLQPANALDPQPRLLEAALVSPVDGSAGDGVGTDAYTWRIFGALGGAVAGGIVGLLVTSSLPGTTASSPLGNAIELFLAAGGAYGGWTIGESGDQGDGTSKAIIGTACVVEAVGSGLFLAALILALRSFT